MGVKSGLGGVTWWRRSRTRPPGCFRPAGNRGGRQFRYSHITHIMAVWWAVLVRNRDQFGGLLDVFGRHFDLFVRVFDRFVAELDRFVRGW